MLSTLKGLISGLFQTKSHVIRVRGKGGASFSNTFFCIQGMVRVKVAQGLTFSAPKTLRCRRTIRFD